ncbi:DgyrCDS2952 [Dimorphilus gyrociliatus]|uniref:DgyrCDS2952 n=1 Tax=Dimorphilus gyrociliatus TaxID=2664684 RepID=A0A7I8VDI5_9ANNE|nr:DgyrCDS2952 [Dimorphilus gyrociliatus]
MATASAARSFASSNPNLIRQAPSVASSVANSGLIQKAPQAAAFAANSGLIQKAPQAAAFAANSGLIQKAPEAAAFAANSGLLQKAPEAAAFAANSGLIQKAPEAAAFAANSGLLQKAPEAAAFAANSGLIQKAPEAAAFAANSGLLQKAPEAAAFAANSGLIQKAPEAAAFAANSGLLQKAPEAAAFAANSGLIQKAPEAAAFAANSGLLQKAPEAAAFVANSGFIQKAPAAAASVANSDFIQKASSVASAQSKSNLISFSPEKETQPPISLPRSSSTMGLLSVPKNNGSETSQPSRSNVSSLVDRYKDLRIIGSFTNTYNTNKPKAEQEVNRTRLAENNPFELIGLNESANSAGQNDSTTNFASESVETTASNNNLSPPSRANNNHISLNTKKKRPPRPPPPKALTKPNNPEIKHKVGPTSLYKSVMTEPHGLAILDYNAKQLNELSFKKGDIILLQRSIDSKWIYAKNGDKEGSCPVNYMNIISRPQYFIEPIVEVCYAKFPFTGENSTELSFREGDKIRLIDRISDEWLIGELNDSIGSFPLSFVELQSPILDNLKNDKKQSLIKKDIRIAIAEYDYISDASEDLQFKKGEVINITEFIDDNWMKGQSSNGSTGLFPSNFVHIIPNEKIACAEFDYESNVEGDLSFKQGDSIIILEDINNEWVKGQVSHKVGICPKNFLKF